MVLFTVLITECIHVNTMLAFQLSNKIIVYKLLNNKTYRVNKSVQSEVLKACFFFCPEFIKLQDYSSYAFYVL